MLKAFAPSHPDRAARRRWHGPGPLRTVTLVLLLMLSAGVARADPSPASGPAPDVVALQRLAEDSKVARLLRDGDLQAELVARATQRADESLAPHAEALARRRALMGGAMVLNIRDGDGTLVHTPALEKARVHLAGRLIEVSQTMVAHGEPGVVTGLVNVTGYFADPATAWFNPELAARLERQQATVLNRPTRATRPGAADDPSNGRRSLLTAQALDRCAAAKRCAAHDRALLTAFVTSLRRTDPTGSGHALARYIDCTGGVNATLNPTPSKVPTSACRPLPPEPPRPSPFQRDEPPEPFVWYWTF